MIKVTTLSKRCAHCETRPSVYVLTFEAQGSEATLVFLCDPCFRRTYQPAPGIASNARDSTIEPPALPSPALCVPPPPSDTVDVLVLQATGLLADAHRLALLTEAGRNLDALLQAQEGCAAWLREGA